MTASAFGEFTREAAEKMRRQRANGHANEEKPELSTVWADDIAVNLDTGGTIDGLAPRTGLVVLYGESGCGKTFVAVDLACHVAAGLPWRGMEVEQGVVVYVAAEAPESLKRRVWAWKQHHGVERLPLLVVQSTVDLLNGDTDAIVELVTRVTAEHGRVALVVIDTLARSMNGNENSPEDMGKYVASCARIREAGDTLTMVVHHTGKDLARGARGHSSLRAATDVELEVSKGEDGSGNVTVTKARDELDKGRFGFCLEPVELGTNAKGRTVTTCVAVEAEATAKTEKAKATALNARQSTVLDCLRTALVDHGQEPPPARDIPRNARVVSFARWCEVTLRYLPGDKPEWRKREDFGRVVEALQAKHLVNHVDGWCWPTLMGGSWATSQTSQTSQCDVSRGSAMAPKTSHRIAPPYRGARMRGLRGHATNGEAEGGQGKPQKASEKQEPARTTANCAVCKKLKAVDETCLCEACRTQPEPVEKTAGSAPMRLWVDWRMDGEKEPSWREVAVLKVTAKKVFIPRDWRLPPRAWEHDDKVEQLALDRTALETAGNVWHQGGRFYTDAAKEACDAKAATERAEREAWDALPFEERMRPWADSVVAHGPREFGREPQPGEPDPRDELGIAPDALLTIGTIKNAYSERKKEIVAAHGNPVMRDLSWFFDIDRAQYRLLAEHLEDDA